MHRFWYKKNYKSWLVVGDRIHMMAIVLSISHIMIARSQKKIEAILSQPHDMTLHEKIALGIEHYIAGTDSDRHHKARQEIPFLAQFAPLIAKYRLQTTIMQAVNPHVPHGGLTEYPKSLVYDLIPDEFRIRTIDVLDERLPGLDDVLSRVDGLSRPLMLKADQ